MGREVAHAMGGQRLITPNVGTKFAEIVGVGIRVA